MADDQPQDGVRRSAGIGGGGLGLLVFVIDKLTGGSNPRPLLYSLFLIALCMIAWSLPPIIRGITNHARQRKRVIAFVGMIASCIGLLSFGAWYFWPPQKSPVRSVSSTIPPSSAPNTSVAATEMDKASAAPLAAMPATDHAAKAAAPNVTEPPIRLVLDCVPASALDTAPQSGLSYSLTISQPGAFSPGEIGLSQLRTIPGTSIYGNQPFIGVHSRRCKITNYSDTVVTNVVLDVIITYYNVTRNSDTVSIKDVNSRELHKIFIDKIDPGLGNDFQFHIDHTWARDFVVDIEFSNEANGLRVDTAKREKVSFIFAGNYPIRLFL